MLLNFCKRLGIAGMGLTSQGSYSKIELIGGAQNIEEEGQVVHEIAQHAQANSMTACERRNRRKGHKKYVVLGSVGLRLYAW